MRPWIWLTITMAVAGAAFAGGQRGPGGELRQCLQGTRWQWDGDGGEEVVFGRDGYVKHPGWTRRGLVTRWRPVDRRTVLLQIEDGRARDLYAVLRFTADMTAYTGHNFHGGARIAESRRLRRTATRRTQRNRDLPRRSRRTDVDPLRF